jgi:agmatine deiminase
MKSRNYIYLAVLGVAVLITILSCAIRPKAGATLTAVDFDNSNDQTSFRFPAEFDKHEAIWLSIKDELYWSGKSRIDVVLDIIKALRPYIKVKATVGTAADLKKFKKLVRANRIDDSHMTYIMMKNDDEADPWLRDQGPNFLRNAEGKKGIS